MSADKKNYWIIGASSGIGKALAFELDKQGYNLILSARRKKLLEDINNQLSRSHNILELDISNIDSIQSSIQKIELTYDNLDSVIFMAGIYAPTSIEDMNVADAKNIIDINFTGCVNFVHHVLPILKKQQQGQIAICSSVAAYRGLPNGQIYSATKAALTNFTESLKLEMKEYDIDVKLISPGFVKTPMTDKNNFKMPMMIEPEQAASEIAKGLNSNAFEIHFPKRFTFLIKLLCLLPYFIYFRLIR